MIHFNNNLNNINYDTNCITYSNINLTLINYSDINRKNIILNNNYYKFVFVRNPFSKLVSSFLNLIIFNDINNDPTENIIYIFNFKYK